jgi:hypothetical protein
MTNDNFIQSLYNIYQIKAIVMPEIFDAFTANSEHKKMKYELLMKRLYVVTCFNW